MLRKEASDEKRIIIVPGDTQATLDFCADHFIKVCQQSIALHDHFFVALSGGSTPKAIYERICHDPLKNLIPWEKVSLFWSDERNVLPEDPSSNYFMAMRAGFDSVPIPPSHIHRMHAEEDLCRNARVYQQVIEKNLGTRPFDLVMLGLGEDGHTASLFPKTEALNTVGKLVVANHVPQKETWRMTLTFECINNARHAVVYVLGEAKKEVVHEVLTTSSDYPIQKVGTKERKAIWILDRAAASLI